MLNVTERATIRKLRDSWRARTEALGLRGKARDESCLEFFLGAAALASELRGDKDSLTVLLLKLTIYFISLRGERGLDDFCKEPPHGKRS